MNNQESRAWNALARAWMKAHPSEAACDWPRDVILDWARGSAEWRTARNVGPATRRNIERLLA